MHQFLMTSSVVGARRRVLIVGGQFSPDVRMSASVRCAAALNDVNACTGMLGDALPSEVFAHYGTVRLTTYDGFFVRKNCIKKQFETIINFIKEFKKTSTLTDTGGFPKKNSIFVRSFFVASCFFFT